MQSRTVAGLVFGLGLLLLGCGGEAETRPNLILISVEGLRPDSLACYGGDPRNGYSICGVARKAGRYVWAFSPSASPGPAAATLLTGRDPEQHEVKSSVASFLGSSQRTLAEKLRDAGYTTAAFVGNPELNRSRKLDQGFDRYGDREPTDSIGQAAQTWAKRASEPWFLWVHFPGFSGARTQGESDQPEWSWPLPDSHLLELDRRIGDLTSRFDDETRPPGILLTGLRGGRTLTLDESSDTARRLSLSQIRVPLIWRPPTSSTEPNVSRRIHAPVGLVDVAPTLLEAAGLPLDADLNGNPLPYSTSDSGPVRTLLASGPEVVAIIHGAEFAQFPRPGVTTAVPLSSRLWPVGEPDSENTPQLDVEPTGSERTRRLRDLAIRAGALPAELPD